MRNRTMWRRCLISLVVVGVLLAAPATSRAYNLWDFHVTPTVYCQVGGAGPAVNWRSDAQSPNNQVWFLHYRLETGTFGYSIFTPGSGNGLNSAPLNLVLFGPRNQQELSPQNFPNGWYLLIALYFENQRWWQVGLAASNWFFVSSDGQGCPNGAASLRSNAEAAGISHAKRPARAAVRQARAEATRMRIHAAEPGSAPGSREAAGSHGGAE